MYTIFKNEQCSFICPQTGRALLGMHCAGLR